MRTKDAPSTPRRRVEVDTAALVEARGDRSRAEVAEAVGISYSALGNIENGHDQPSYRLALALAGYLGVDLASFARVYRSHQVRVEEEAS